MVIHLYSIKTKKNCFTTFYITWGFSRLKKTFLLMKIINFFTSTYFPIFKDDGPKSIFFFDPPSGKIGKYFGVKKWIFSWIKTTDSKTHREFKKWKTFIGKMFLKLIYTYYFFKKLLEKLRNTEKIWSGTTRADWDLLSLDLPEVHIFEMWSPSSP